MKYFIVLFKNKERKKIINTFKTYEKAIQFVLRQYCGWCKAKQQTVSRFEFKFNNSKTSIQFDDTTTTPVILSFCSAK